MIEFLAEESRSREPDRIAYFDVSYELLAAMLKLPEDAEVVLADSTVGEYSPRHRMLRLYVRHPELAEVETGGMVPRVQPMYHREVQVIESGAFDLSLETITFEGW